jgi:hypothetical protein
MRFQPHLRVVATAVFLFVGWSASASFACLRDALDDRAVQWSSEIVLANLLAINNPQPMVPASAPQADDANSSSTKQFQTYDFQITASFDGPGKVGDKVRVIRFILGPDSEKSSICGQAFTPSQVGKSFLLLLRPEADLLWSDRPGDPDPRTPELHALKAFVVVHLESAYDIGADGLEDAKYTISSTRAAEAQFKADDAKLQAQTMIDAADDTEESQAEHNLMEMGPKVVPVLQDAMSTADPGSRGRLQRVIRAVSPPTLLASIHQH